MIVVLNSQLYALKLTKLADSAKMLRRMLRVYPVLSSGIFMPVPRIPGTKSPYLLFAICSEYALTYSTSLCAACSSFFLSSLRYS